MMRIYETDNGEGYSFPIDDETIPFDYFDDENYQVPPLEWLEPEPTKAWVCEWAWSNAIDRCPYCGAPDGQCSH